MKVLIIGVDGATWDVFDDFLLDNHMPNLKRLKTGGFCGILRSTDPPVTPAAWTTCITGCQPYTHGVLGFKDYSFKDDHLRISSAASCRVPNIWQQLSGQGYKVASINVPWTYPCPEVSGIIVAGYGLPSTEVQFTYPVDFKNELLECIPDYDVSAKWEKSQDYDAARFEANVCRVEHSFEQRLEAARIVNRKIKPDVMMVQFQDIDLIQHHIWPYLGKSTRGLYAVQRDRLFSMFKKLDRTIGSLMELAGTEQPLIAVVSDHGFGRMLGSIKPNMLLYKWGYLKYQSAIGRMIRRLRRNLRSLSSNIEGTMPIELKSPVDWRRSKAMVMYAAMNGHIYLNVKGRNPHGFIRRGAEYDSVIEDLKSRFSHLTNPATGEPMFSRVVRTAELYNRKAEDVERLGDLILVPKPGYIVHQSTARKGGYLSFQSEDSLAGCHYYEGIYIFYGPNIKGGENKRAHIVDIAPTIYAALGAKLPAYLDGKVLKDVFSEDVRIEYQSAQAPDSQRSSKRQELSKQEQELVAQRLSELGYLD